MVVIGLIGAGLMGAACARRLKQAGFEVVAYDLDEAKRVAVAQFGAHVATSATGVLAQCDTVVLCVFNTDQVEQVVEGDGGVLDAVRGDSKPRIVICTSTCDPDRLAALAERVAPRGARVLEAPVSGTSRQVMDGDGVGLIGGDRALMESAAAVLDAICPRRYYLGNVGSG